MIKNEQIEIIKKIIGRHKTNKIGIFGSYARNEETNNSDLDIYVSFSEAINLFQLIDLENKIAEQLKIKVELVTDNAIHPKIKPYILKDLKTIA